MAVDATIVNVTHPSHASPGETVQVRVHITNYGTGNGYVKVGVWFLWLGTPINDESSAKSWLIGASAEITVNMPMPDGDVEVYVYTLTCISSDGSFDQVDDEGPMYINLSTAGVQASILASSYNIEQKAGLQVLLILTLKNTGTAAGYLEPTCTWTIGGHDDVQYGGLVWIEPGGAYTWNFNKEMPSSSMYIEFWAWHWDPDAEVWIPAVGQGPYLIKLVTDPDPDPDEWKGFFEWLKGIVEDGHVRLAELDAEFNFWDENIDTRIEVQTDSWWVGTWAFVDGVIKTGAALLTGDINRVEDAHNALKRLWDDINFSWPAVHGFVIDNLPGMKPIVDIWDGINALRSKVDVFELSIGDLVTAPIDWLWDRLWAWLNEEVSP